METAVEPCALEESSACRWPAIAAEWLGPRHYQLIGAADPRPRCEQRWVAIVASHRQRWPESDRGWLQALDCALMQIAKRDQTLLVSRQSPSGPLIADRARLLGCRLIELEVPESHTAHRSPALRRQASRHANCPNERPSTPQMDPPSGRDALEPERADPWMRRLVLAPPLERADCLEPWQTWGQAHVPPASDLQRLPLIDRALMVLADEVRVIAWRCGGRTDRLIQRRLADARFPRGSIYLAMESHGCPTPSMVDRLSQGAVGWIVPSDHLAAAAPPSSTAREADSATTSVPVVAIHRVAALRAAAENWRWLTHCVRARQGAWPDQSEPGYHAELLTPDAKTTFDGPLATLVRILEQPRLLATTFLKRSSTPTLSFSAVPLPQLLTRRRFRSHLQRWDWEPYGLCIDRAWLHQRGARPVCYGDEQAWNQMPSEDQPFFQPSTGRRDAWDNEQEWRAIGDLRLAEIPWDCAWVFVPTRQEAQRIASISRWPIALVSSFEKASDA